MLKQRRIRPNPKPVGDLVEMLIAIDLGILYLLRWPYALLWLKKNFMHEYHELNPRGQTLFAMLCMIAAGLQANILILLCVPVVESAAVLTLACAYAIAYAVLSVVRFIIWCNYRTFEPAE